MKPSWQIEELFLIRTAHSSYAVLRLRPSSLIVKDRRVSPLTSHLCWSPALLSISSFSTLNHHPSCWPPLDNLIIAEHIRHHSYWATLAHSYWQNISYNYYPGFLYFTSDQYQHQHRFYTGKIFKWDRRFRKLRLVENVYPRPFYLCKLSPRPDIPSRAQ